VIFFISLPRAYEMHSANKIFAESQSTCFRQRGDLPSVSSLPRVSMCLSGKSFAESPWRGSRQRF
jgi:hypothetical protein